jgi:hypothetical protein
VSDAVVTVQLVEMSMQNAAMLGSLYSALHSKPSEQPEEDCTLSFHRAETEIAQLISTRLTVVRVLKAKILRSLRLSDLVDKVEV